jgi:ABC-2 type transport system permease protein
MNIFLRELKANFRSLIIWGVIVILFESIGFSKFSAYEGNPEMLAILDDIPPALLAAFNFNAFNLTTITGFFGVMFTYFALLLSVAAVLWGSDIISKEERDKTVEFSLTLPVTREKLVTAKILAAIVNCIGLLLITWGATLANAAKYQPNSEFYDFLSLSMLALFIMQMIFLAIGIFLGCAMKQYKQASSVAIALILGTYFLSIIAGLNKNLDFLKYFSPFKYFNPAQLLQQSQIELLFLWISVGIIAVSLFGAYISYSRRDLYI